MDKTLALLLRVAATQNADLEVPELIGPVRKNTGCLLYNGVNGGGEATKSDTGEKAQTQTALLLSAVLAL